MQDQVISKGRKPPIGGANLECLFSCENLRRKAFADLVSICRSNGFVLVEREPLLAYGDDPIGPVMIASANELEEFITNLAHQGILRCIANFTGMLVDVKTSLNLLVDFDHLVVSASVPEDVLWKFSEDPAQADFRRLKAFATCCEKVASAVSPVFGYLGTETLHPEDMQFDRAEREGALPVDESFFSESRLRELFDWYLTTYVKRWQK